MAHALIDEAVKKCSSRYRLAQIVGAHQSQLSEIYSGKKKMPPKLAAKIAAVAGLDAQEAAAVAIIESEDDPDEREALKRVFFRTGAVATLRFSTNGASRGPSPATEQTNSPHEDTENDGSGCALCQLIARLLRPLRGAVLRRRPHVRWRGDRIAVT